MDSNLRRSLVFKDGAKRRKANRDSTKSGKLMRCRNKNSKYSEAKRDYMKSLNEGLAYESGIALREAKRAVKNAPIIRNPKGTTKEKMRCKYHHPQFCTKLGHVDAKSKECFAHGKSAIERNAIIKHIFDEAVQKRMNEMANVGEYIHRF